MTQKQVTPGAMYVAMCLAKFKDQTVVSDFPDRTFITYVCWNAWENDWKVGHVTEDGIGEVVNAGDDRPWVMVRQGMILMQRHLEPSKDSLYYKL